LPNSLQVDNGPEFTSRTLDDWAHRRRGTRVFSRPDTPTAHAFVEAFTDRLRVECLDQPWSVSLGDARPGLEAWRIDASEVRPPTAPDNQTALAARATWMQDQAGEETG
jgi:putative transposase